MSDESLIDMVWPYLKAERYGNNVTSIAFGCLSEDAALIGPQKMSEFLSVMGAELSGLCSAKVIEGYSLSHEKLVFTVSLTDAMLQQAGYNLRFAPPDIIAGMAAEEATKRLNENKIPASYIE